MLSGCQLNKTELFHDHRIFGWTALDYISRGKQLGERISNLLLGNPTTEIESGPSLLAIKPCPFVIPNNSISVHSLTKILFSSSWKPYIALASLPCE